MAGSMDFETQLQGDTRDFVTAFRDAINTVSSLGSASDASTQNLEQMSEYGRQHIQSLNLSLAQARAELIHLSTTNATPQDIQNAENRVGLLETAISQAGTVFNAFGTHAQHAMQEAANAAGNATAELTPFQNQVSGLVSNLDNVRMSLDENGNSASHTREELEQLARNATAQLQLYEQQLQEARLEVNRLSATNASPQDIEEARQRVRQLETGVGQVTTSLHGFQNAARTSTNTLENGVRDSGSALEKARTGVSALQGALALLGTGLSIQSVAETADSYTNLAAQINVATKEGGDFASAMTGVQQVAIATNSNLSSTAALFGRLNTVGKDMGLTQQQALDLTKTVTQAIQIGGSSAQEADGAVTQLIQAMQGGVLRGEEFNSIMEGGYGLAEALAKGLGVTTGELRKMAEAGELSSERVVKAIGSQAASVQATYDKFPTTIGNALQRISTSWEILIGKMDQANGASSTVAQWLVMLADNLQTLDFLLEDAGNGFVWVGDQLKKIDTATIEALKTALTSVYDTLKSVASTIGTAFEITFDVLNEILSSVFSFNSGVDTAQDKTSGLTKLLQAFNVVLGFVGDGFSAIGIGLNLLSAVVYDVAAAFTYWKSKILFGSYKDEALKEYEELSNKAQAYYDKSSAGAMQFKSKGMEAIESISKTQAEKDAEAVVSSKAKLDKLLADQQSEVSGKKTSEEEKLKAVQAYAEAAIVANGGVLDGTIQADLTTKGYMVTLDQSGKVAVTSMLAAQKATEEKTKATELAKEREKKAEEDYQNLVTANIPKRIALEQQIIDAKKSGDLTALLSAQTSLAAINAKEAELNEARKARSAEVASGIQGSADKARKAAQALGLDLDVALNRVSEKFTANKVHLDNYANGLTLLGAKGTQATEALYQGWEKWAEAAKNQAEIDAAKAKLLEFEKQGVFSAKQVQIGMEYLDQVNGKIPENISEIEKAYKLLGVTSKEEATKIADSQIRAFNVMKQSGTASTEQVKQGLINMADKIYASGDAAKIAWYEGQLAASGLATEIDGVGKTTVTSISQAEQSMNRLSNSVGNAGRSFRGMAQDARNAAEEIKSTTDARNDALTARSEAQAKERAESKSSKANGGSFASYSKADVLAELKGMGYDDKEAQKLAGSIMSAAFAKDKDTMQKNMGTGNATYLNAAFDKLLSQGQTASGGSAEVQKRLAALANGKGSVSVATPTNSEPASTRRLELVNGAQTATLSGSASDLDAMEKMLSEFEMLKKGS